MFTKIVVGTALLATFIAPLAASAGEVQNRLNNETARIDQGVHNGSVTRREYDHLDRSENHIQAERNRDLRNNNGHLTGAEYRSLNRQENGLSRNIYFDKHNLSRQH